MWHWDRQENVRQAWLVHLFKDSICLVDSFMDSDSPRLKFTFRSFSGDDYGQDSFPLICNVTKINIAIPTLIKNVVSYILNYFCIFYVKLQLNIF